LVARILPGAFSHGLLRVAPMKENLATLEPVPLYRLAKVLGFSPRSMRVECPSSVLRAHTRSTSTGAPRGAWPGEL